MYHIVVLKRQNRLKVGTEKHMKLKVKMQSVSDDDVSKKNFLKSHATLRESVCQLTVSCLLFFFYETNNNVRFSRRLQR